MRILLDESVPRRLRRMLPGHEVATVPEAGWAGVQNGELLRLAADRFDVLITCDQSVPFQQNLAGLDLRIVVLAGPSNKLGDLEPLAPQVLKAVDELEPGQFRTVRSEE